MDNPIAPFMAEGKLCIDVETLDPHPDLRLTRIELTERDKIRLARELLTDVETQRTD